MNLFPTPRLSLLSSLFLLVAGLALNSRGASAPAAHWNFDLMDKGAFPASGPAARPAVPSGKVETVPGFKGSALCFGDSPAGQVSIPVDVLRIANDGSFTLEFWLRARGRSPQYGTCVDAGGAKGFVIRTNSSGRLSFGGGGTWNAIATEAPLVEHAWTHVALVHKNGQATLYVDGRVAGSINVEAKGVLPSLSLGSVTERAKTVDGSFAETMAKPLIGDIDDLKIHAVALSATEVDSLVKSSR